MPIYLKKIAKKMIHNLPSFKLKQLSRAHLHFFNDKTIIPNKKWLYF